DDDVDALALEGALDLLELGAVRLDEAEPGMRERGGEILPLLRRGVERVEVVEADHPVPAREEPLDQVAADEPGGAGDEDRGAGSHGAPECGIRRETTQD